MPRYASADQIKVGVVGYSGAFSMGRAHLNEMAKAGMVPVAVVELSSELRKQAKKDFPSITTYPNVGAMLNKSSVDLVAIITPHNTHAKLAMQCLRAGKHVVCEKPLAINTTECDHMIDTAMLNNVVLSTYHNRHWDGCIMKAVEEIRGGAIGDVVRIEAHMGGYGQPGEWWRSSKSISGGIMYDWGVHLLEYSLQLIDGNMMEVTGFAKNGYWAPKTKWGKDTNEDEGQAIVRFSNGQWLTLTISQIDSNPKRGILEITGTQGTYIMDHGGYEIITRNEKGETVIRRGANPPGEGWRLYQNIADHLTKDESLVITARWARRPIHILDLADKSAKQGRTLLSKYN